MMLWWQFAREACCKSLVVVAVVVLEIAALSSRHESIWVVRSVCSRLDSANRIVEPWLDREEMPLLETTTMMMIGVHFVHHD